MGVIKKAFVSITLVCLVVIVFVITVLFTRISNDIEQAKLVGQVLSKINSETEIIDISVVERLLETHDMILIEYTVVKEISNEVISQKSSGRSKLKYYFSTTTNLYGWSLAPCEYIGKEGTFPAIVCDKRYKAKDLILKLQAIVKIK
jgi:hypothetical protein